MRGTTADNREVMIPLHDLHVLDLGFPLELCPMYHAMLYFLYQYGLDFSTVFFQHRGVSSL